MGRPFMGENPENRVNPAAIQIRTSFEVHERLLKEAELRGMSLAEFIRQLIVQALELLEPPSSPVQLRKGK